jgi:hypothetical protein
VNTVLWQRTASPGGGAIPGTEQCELAAIPGGHRLSGLVLTVAHARPIHIVYQVDVDERWHTRSVRATLFGLGEPQSIGLDSNGAGQWFVAGMLAPTLDDCLDVDLEWTPATNTLPIRRLNLAIGESTAIAAAWVRLDGLAIERLDQVYERLDESTWLYRSNAFSARLTVDSEGLVLDYQGGWRAVAHSDPEALHRIEQPRSGRRLD